MCILGRMPNKSILFQDRVQHNICLQVIINQILNICMYIEVIHIVYWHMYKAYHEKYFSKRDENKFGQEKYR